MLTSRQEMALSYPSDDALGDLKSWMLGERKTARGAVEHVDARYCVVQLELLLTVAELEEVPGPRIREPTILVPGQRQTLTEKLTHARYEERETAESIKQNLELKISTELGTKLAASGALGTEVLARLAKSAEFSWRFASEIKSTLEAARSRRHMLRFDASREFTISNEFAPSRDRQIEVTAFRYARHVRFTLELVRINVLDVHTRRSQLRSLRALGTTEEPAARLLSWDVHGARDVGYLDVYTPSNNADFYARVARLGRNDWDKSPYVAKIPKLPRAELEARTLDGSHIRLVPVRPREELLDRLEAVALDAKAIAKSPTEALEKERRDQKQKRERQRRNRVEKLRAKPPGEKRTAKRERKAKAKKPKAETTGTAKAPAKRRSKPKPEAAKRAKRRAKPRTPSQ